jgi:ferritin-like metal-binding protein YciE
MPVKTLNDLFRRTLQDVFYAERQTFEATGKLVTRATLPQLKAVINQHRSDTERRIERLESVFQTIKMRAEPHQAAGIDGLLVEAETLANEIDDPDTRDAGLLAAMQEIEHYRINRYGTLLAWASQLGLREAAPALKENLAASKERDRVLSTVAETSVNRMAAA